ncbi:tripartite tricarboxylate transporter substrate binding protein [Hydrogenophaga sp.]|uniref:Bug family tripartite tricarboxylate transporter substrate binding protein n=1 Tax=Hydrogenophaga sp. TaxID=1904254 RepID=UPI00261CC543|nr:tripartite tricarboxylate transporter substrate binding protein [Hydrogenophaga sp.]MCW5652192.1 tripartite tricarboxylate transporter substrate binding protein [Hydrogenophaga sp.]
MKRRQLIASLGAAGAITLLPSGAFAQEAFPSSVIRIVVPIAAGGVTDAMARTLADEMKKQLTVPVIVDNKPGGNFGIGLQAVASAKPDGHTIGWIFASAMTTLPHLYKGLTYKPSDFQPVGTLVTSHFVLAVPKSSPYNNLREYVEAMKKQKSPGLLAVSAVGGGPHLLMEGVSAASGFSLQPVAYRGEAPAVLELVAGQVPAFVGVMASVAEHYKTGSVKVLAISSEQRTADLPDVPTFKEQGFPSGVVTFWHGLSVPAGTPRAVVDKLNAIVRTAANSPAFQARLKGQADTYLGLSTPEQMDNLIRIESQQNEQLIKARNIRVE